MNKNNLVSIILFSHDNERVKIIVNYIVKMLPNIELIVMDSSKEDKTSLFKNEKITYVHCPQLNMNEKVLQGVSRASCEYVLFHPDGELLNIYALNYLTEQIINSKVIIKDTLSPDITFLKENNKYIIRPRNYYKFLKNSSYCISSNNIEECLAPMHQIFWAIHKKDIWKSAAEAGATVEWEKNNFKHLTLAERITYFLIHYQEGEVLISSLPLFLRSDNVTVDSTTDTQHIPEWLSHFDNNSREHKIFFEDLCQKYAKVFNLSNQELQDIFLLILRTEVEDIRSINYHATKQEVYTYCYETTSGFKISIDDRGTLMNHNEYHSMLLNILPFLKLINNELEEFSKYLINR